MAPSMSPCIIRAIFLRDTILITTKDTVKLIMQQSDVKSLLYMCFCLYLSI